MTTTQKRFAVFMAAMIFAFSFGQAIAGELSISTDTHYKEHSYFESDVFIPDIETFMKIGYAADPVISPDGKTIYFSNNFSRTAQLYKIQADNRYPYQLTFMDGAVKYPQLSPDGKWMTFLSDNDGDEQYQVFLMETATGRYEALTDAADIRFGVPVWSPDMKKIYFRANMGNPADFYIYEMDLKTRNVQPIVERPGYHSVVSVSKDGKRLLFTRYNSNVDTDLYFLILETGCIRHLTPHEGDVYYRHVGISPDNKYLYYLTDDTPNKVIKLSKLDLDSGETEIIFDKDSPWEVEGAFINDQRNVIALTINENGYGPIRLLDLETMQELPAPEFDGIASAVSFSERSTIAFDLNLSTRTTEIFTWDWEHPEKGMQKMTNSSYAGIDPELFTEPELVTYESFDGLEIPAFLFLPPGYEKGGGPIPFIIHFHGGPEGQTRPYFQRHFNYLLLNGFGILAPNIRGSSGYGKEFMALDNYKKRLDSVKDGYYAAKYLIDQGYSAEKKIGIKGGSYGGYMVMALITEYPDMWGAAYESVGIADFVNFLENTKDYRRALREAEYGPLSDREFLESISPINKLDVVKTPLMVSHGKNDPRVPVSEAHLIIDNLEARGVAVKALIFEDEGHGISRHKNRMTLYREMAKFFEEHLK